MRCALCGRPLEAAAIFIGNLAVGPVCAKRHGLVAKARKRYGVLWVAPQNVPKVGRARPDQRTLDLFEGVLA